MKKIALLGDSIRLIGYGTKVPELLGNEYEVWQPDDNCRFAQYTFCMIAAEWGKHLEGCELIHWNNGLWDTCHRFDDGCFSTIEEYVRSMKRIARILLRLSKNVVFATTTPTKPKHKDQNNEEIDAYNAAVVPELRKMGVIINDLASFVKEDINGYICDDLIHLSAKGIDACANQIASFIKNTLEK